MKSGFLDYKLNNTDFVKFMDLNSLEIGFETTKAAEQFCYRGRNLW